MNFFFSPLFFVQKTYVFSLKSIPDMLAWVPYVTPSKFAYDGLIKNELCNGTWSLNDEKKR